MAVVRSDIHGAYLLTGGYLFRPVFPDGYKHLEKDLFEVKPKDAVKAHHVGGSSVCKITQGSQVMYWYSHGDYFDVELQKNKPSESLFKPERNTW